MSIKLFDADDETIEEINKFIESNNYWVNAGLNLIRHLHESGMKMKDIYEIAERPLSADKAAA